MGGPFSAQSADLNALGMSGFHFRGGGGVNSVPKNWGGGLGKGLN